MLGVGVRESSRMPSRVLAYTTRIGCPFTKAEKITGQKGVFFFEGGAAKEGARACFGHTKFE